MSTRRIVGGGVAIAALAGVLTGGAAWATGTDPQPAPPAAQCSAPTEGSASNSPGVQSGNVVQAPVNNCSGPLVYAPISTNICGNSVNEDQAQMNPAFGNTCVNENSGVPE